MSLHRWKCPKCGTENLLKKTVPNIRKLMDGQTVSATCKKCGSVPFVQLEGKLKAALSYQ